MKVAERWFVMAGVALLGAIALAGLLVAIFAAWLLHDLPDASELADYRPPTATRVYAGDGTLIGEFSDERRIYVPYEQIPTEVVQAFLAAEDRNFFQHGGIDVSGLGRAMFKNIFNAATGRRLEGGSTITQQVAKNVLLTNESTLGRKLKEAILSSRLEATLSKEQILELYLNEIFLGYRSYGVASAAFNYFGKSLQELTPEEAAFLAALPKGPNNYHPKRHPEAAKARRDWVLGEMLQNQFLTQAAYDAAVATPLTTREAPRRAEYQDADFFVEEARRIARANPDFGDQLNAGGFYMRTTLDPSLQTAARDALMRGLENYDRRHGWRGPWGTTDFAPGWQAVALRQTAPPERREWRAAAVESVSGNTVRVRTARDDETGTLIAADAAWANANRPLRRGDLIFVEPRNGQFALKQVPNVNGALVGRRILLRPVELQPRHAGAATTGFIVQAVRLCGRARRRLHACLYRRRWSHQLCRRARRAPVDARKLQPAVLRSPDASPRAGAFPKRHDCQACQLDWHGQGRRTGRTHGRRREPATQPFGFAGCRRGHSA